MIELKGLSKGKEKLSILHSLRRKFKSLICLLMVAALFLLSGCGEAYEMDKATNLSLSDDKQKSYSTDVVKRGTVVSEVKITCAYNPKEKQHLMFEGEQGKVKSINVIKGDLVKKGDVLAKLDVEKYEDAIFEEQHNLEMQQINTQNLKDLKAFDLRLLERTYGYMTEQELEGTNYGLEKRLMEKDYNRDIEDSEDAEKVISQKIGEYQAKIDEGTLVSPCDGVVTMCKLDKVGQYSDPTEEVITLIRDEDLVFISDEVDLASYVNEGEKYTIIVGKGENAKTMEVEPIDMNNEDGKLYFRLTIPVLTIEKGTPAEIWIETDKKNDVLYVPNSAVHSSADKSYVYKISDEGMREVCYVEKGITGRENTQIVDGLKEGDVIITN